MTRAAERAFCLSALVLTEDGSSEAFATVRLLVKHLLQIVDPNTAVQHIDFEPATDEHVRRACIANLWKSRALEDQRRKIALFREIAGKLCEPGGFVFFHFDGDTVWSNRGACENARQFCEIVVNGVRETLSMRLSKPRYSDPDATMYSEAELGRIVEDAMARLFQVVPHYSIEAWCLQNVAMARKLCEKHHHGAHCEDFDKWERDRTLLDEIEKPKDVCCLHSEHNGVLVGPGFPRKEALKAGKSFASVATTLCNAEGLTKALEMTYRCRSGDSVG